MRRVHWKDVNGSGPMGSWKGRFGNGKGSESRCAGNMKHNNPLQKESGQRMASHSTLNAGPDSNSHENPFKPFLYAITVLEE